MEKIYGKHKLVGLQLFLSGTPTFSSGTPTFCQMGVLNSCFQNPSESSADFYACSKMVANILPVDTPSTPEIGSKDQNIYFLLKIVMLHIPS